MSTLSLSHIHLCCWIRFFLGILEVRVTYNDASSGTPVKFGHDELQNEQRAGYTFACASVAMRRKKAQV